MTQAAPRAARPPVLRTVEVVGRRPVDAYVELTLAAPDIAERTQPGQFVAFAVGGPTTGLLLRRSIAVSTAGEGRVTVVVSAAGPGSAWLTERQPGNTLDVVGPRGRPSPDPPAGTRALLVGGGYGAAALVGLAARLKAAGSEVVAVAGAASAGRLCSVQELTGGAGSGTGTTEDGSPGRRGRVTAAVDDLLPGCGVVYAGGPMRIGRAVADAATALGIPSYVAVE